MYWSLQKKSKDRIWRACLLVDTWRREEWCSWEGLDALIFSVGLTLCMHLLIWLLVPILNILCNNKVVIWWVNWILESTELLQHINWTQVGDCRNLWFITSPSEAQVTMRTCDWRLKWRAVSFQSLLGMFCVFSTKALKYFLNLFLNILNVIMNEIF